MLQIENLEVCYGAISALQGISLTVGKGEIVTLIGANGAGKSTTLRAISGILKPKAGRILYNGENIAGFTPHKIVERGICHVPEGRMVFPGLTVLENLRMGAFRLNDATRFSKVGTDMQGPTARLAKEKTPSLVTLSTAQPYAPKEA